MKKLIIGAAVVALAAMGGARTASAATACKNNLQDPSCSGTQKCAKKILEISRDYAKNINTILITSINSNTQGKNKDPYVGKVCGGGLKLSDSSPLNGVKCVANNGVCKDGARKNLACSYDFECPGTCSGSPTTTCTANVTCAPGTCKAFGKGCDRTKGCNQAGTVNNDQFKCEVKTRKSGLVGDYNKKADGVKVDVGKQCPSIDLEDLGLPTPECKGKCRGGSPSSLAPCVTTKDCGVCKVGIGATGQSCTGNADCTTGTSPYCDTTGGACQMTNDDVADCITQSLAGDLKNAVVADATTRQVTRLGYISKPVGAKTGALTMAQVPRKRTIITMPNLLQIAVKSSEAGSAGGGGATPSNMARCQNAGANTGIPCIEDKDCNLGGVTTGVCVPDCCTCTGLGTCDVATIASGVQALCRGTCNLGTNDGLPCTVPGDCPSGTCVAPADLLSQVVCELRGNITEAGNFLSNPTNQVSNGIRTCLVTKAVRPSGAVLVSLGDNGAEDAADRGHCVNTTTGVVGAACDGTLGDQAADPTCGADRCMGGVNSFGGTNLNTGASFSTTPIATDVYLTSITPSGKACPVCVSFKCDSGANKDGACIAPDNDTDEACLPTDGGDGAGNSWGKLSTLPNPYNIGTDRTVMTASATVGSPDGAWPSGKGFCGYCSTSTAKSVGCRTDAVPDSCIALGLGVCTTSSTFAGFRGDAAYDDVPGSGAGKTGMQASVQGIPDTYASVGGGMFCTGMTNSTLADPSVGLPGPVRILQPYLVNWTFSTK